MIQEDEWYGQEMQLSLFIQTRKHESCNFYETKHMDIEINSTISFMANIKCNRIQVISINIISAMILRFNS